MAWPKTPLHTAQDWKGLSSGTGLRTGAGPSKTGGALQELASFVRKHSPSLSWVGQSLRGLGWAFKVLGVPGPEGIPNPVQSTPCPTLIRLIFFLVQPVGTRLLLISRTPLA